MKNNWIILASLVLLTPKLCSGTMPFSSELVSHRHRLMPIPASIQFGEGRLRIDASFTAAVVGYSDSRLQGAIQRAARRLEGRVGFEFSRVPPSDARSATLSIQCGAGAAPVPSLKDDESYSLDVSQKQALIKAGSVVGVIRGLETFLQLLDSDSDGYLIPVVSIQDKPRFPWRGLLIDVGRHFEPVEVIKRNLDAMAAVKLNVLHWHLTEDQGFRIESKRYPRLHQMGSDGLYYTQEQIRDVVAYATERGIRVMPEFDIPGHVTSWLVGHPELGSAPGPYQIERKNGIFEPALDPTREETYKFLEGFFADVSKLFPDEYIHIGGDENEGHQWNRNPQIQAFMKAKAIQDNHGLQAYFNKRVSKILDNLGKKMIGWDEILHPELPKDTVIQSWRGPASLADAAKRGYRGILSAGYYIDLGHPAWKHYAVDPLPADANLREEELSRILGGEATMWGEWVSPETIDSRIWPRAAAIAERLWSPSSITDVAEMYRRLDFISIKLEELGLTHERNVDVLLRRMIGSKEIGALKTLVSLVEPVKDYRRAQARPATMLTPLTRLIDAARPDSEAGRHFSALVDDLLADAPDLRRSRDKIRSLLTHWYSIRPELDVVIDGAPILAEADGLPGNLAETASVGIEALEYLSSEKAPPTGWREGKLAVLVRTAKPKAEVELSIIEPVRKLVILAAEMSELRSIPHSQWRDRVRTLASEQKTKVSPD